MQVKAEYCFIVLLPIQFRAPSSDRFIKQFDWWRINIDIEQGLLFPYWGKLFYVIKVTSVDKNCLHMEHMEIYAGNSAVVNEYDPRSMPHGNEMVVSNTIKLLQKRTPSSDRFQSFDSVLCFVMQDPNCKMKQLVVVSSVLYLHYLKA